MAYTPAGNLTTTGTLRHLASVYYDRVALDRLLPLYQFAGVTESRPIPLRSGKTIQFFRYTTLGSNSTPASEGTVGTSLTLDSNVISATVSEFSDFITGSTLLQDTAIDPFKENAARLLGERAGLSVDTVTRTEFDANVSSVSSVAMGGVASIGDLRRAKHQLEGINVRPREGSDFVAIAHPYVFYDIVADNTAGGFIDVMRYANPQAFIDSQSYNEAGKIEGCRIRKSTNVGTTGTAPNVQYYIYVVGEGAVGTVDLTGRGPSKVVDPSKQRFKINVGEGGPSLPDPTGTIGFWVSYRFVFTVKTLDSTNYRYKIIKADSSIV